MKTIIKILIIIDIICLLLILISPFQLKNLCAIIILLSMPVILLGNNVIEKN
jgi:hypothetical protein